jgi:hypothetical protein
MGIFYIHYAEVIIYQHITARKGRRKAAEVPKSAIREEYKQPQPNTEETKNTPGRPEGASEILLNFIWGTAQPCAMQSLHTRRPCYRDDRRCAPVPAQDYW